MAACQNIETDAAQKSHFKDISAEELDEIFNNRKAKSTQNATKLWMNAFRAFLEEKNLPEADTLTNEELQDALYLFYPSIQKKDNWKWPLLRELELQSTGTTRTEEP